MSRGIWHKKFYNSQPSICYHSIGHKGTGGFSSHIHDVSLDIFENQLKSLKKKCTLLPIEAFLSEKAKGRKKISSITFDDGYKNVLTNAAPVLESLDIPFTLFFNTRLLENRIFWRDKIRIVLNSGRLNLFKDFLEKLDFALFSLIDWNDFYFSTKKQSLPSNALEHTLDTFFQAEGIPVIDENLYLKKSDFSLFPKHLFQVGNHTHNHFYMSSVSDEIQRQEIEKAHDIIQKLPCNKTNIFAIPFGGLNSFNQVTLDILFDLGYNGFLMTNLDQFGRKAPLLPYEGKGMLYSNRILPKNEPFKFLF